MSLAERIRRLPLTPICLILAFALGAFVRFWDLHDARFISSDEFRSIADLSPYTLGRVPFMNLIYHIPMLFTPNEQRAALYTTAFWGFLSIGLVYMIAKSVFSARTGAIAALVFALFALHVELSRHALPPVFQTFLILIAFWLTLRFLQELRGHPTRSLFTIAAVGICLGLSFLTYVSSYTVIITFFLVVVLLLIQGKCPWKQTLSFTFLLGIGSLAPLLICEGLGRMSIDASYFHELWLFQKDVEKGDQNWVGIEFFNPAVLLPPFQHVALEGGVLQLVLMLFGVGFAVFMCFRRKDRSFRLMILIAGISYAIYSILCLLGYHASNARRVAFLIPFACIFVGYLLDRIEERVGRLLVPVFLVVFVVCSMGYSKTIIHHTFKIKPITNYLKDHNISKRSVATELDLSEDGDSLERPGVPSIHIPEENARKIQWLLMKYLYDQKGVRYLLTSGFGDRSFIGVDDPILKRLRPLKSWSHPKNSYHPMYEFYRYLNLKVADFKLYDLKLVFEP